MQAFLGIVLGQRGAGKSNMLFKRLAPLISGPVLILDTLGGDVTYGMHFSSMRDLAWQFLEGYNHSGVYVLNADSEEECSAFFRTVWNLGRAGHGAFWVVVDEVDQFCTTHTVEEYLDKSIRYGRRYGINFLFAARRVGEINTKVRSQSDFIISFRQTEPADVKAISERSSEASSLLPDLSLWRNTGEPSEFVVIGELPSYFLAITKDGSYVKLNSHKDG